MYYIEAASTIAHQPIFKQQNFADQLVPLQGQETLEVVAYKEYIEPGLLRRMSKLLRMGVACAKECLLSDNGTLLVPDAIIVGTGLGCLLDTEKFLDTTITVSGMLPPTSFIQSTHNTIAGQISLSLSNHSYNMTHTQNTLSFEHALLDGLVWLETGKEVVLVGAADEKIDFFDQIADQFGLQTTNFTSGASFFTVTNRITSKTMASVVDVAAITGEFELEKEINTFLVKNNLTLEALDHLYYQPPIGTNTENSAPFAIDNFTNSLLLSGVYATASAFAMHLAVDQLSQLSKGHSILICNQLSANNLGLILVESIEA